MRQKTLISALVLTAFIAAPLPALAADIFIKKNKDPVQEQPVEDEAPQQMIPGTTVKAHPAPVIPQGATTPGAAPQQTYQPPILDPKAAPPEACSKQDAEQIIKMDASLKRTDDAGPDDPNSEGWMNLAKDPAKLQELIKLYTRCSAYLAEYKKAQEPGAKGKSKQTAKPVMRKQ